MSDIMTPPDAYHHPALHWLLSREPVMSMRNPDFHYANQVVTGAKLDPPGHSHQLEHTPIIPGTLVICDRADKPQACDNGEGRILTYVDSHDIGSICYTSGKIEFSKNVIQPECLATAAYEYDPDAKPVLPPVSTPE